LAAIGKLHTLCNDVEGKIVQEGIDASKEKSGQEKETLDVRGGKSRKQVRNGLSTEILIERFFLSGPRPLDFAPPGIRRILTIATSVSNPEVQPVTRR
jgi:hypothetical protein